MIISSPAIAATGTIRGVFPSPNGRALAVVSEFPVLTNPPGRTVYGQPLRYRVGLYLIDSSPEPFAVFDDARHPINHVAFHPSEPVIAVAGGRYDGGYAFEGEVNLFDWIEKRSWPAVGSIPEVVRCRFHATGERLDLSVRPWNDDWAAARGESRDDMRIYRLGLDYRREAVTETADLDPAVLMPLAEAEIEDDPVELRPSVFGRTLHAWFGVERGDGPGAIWDVAWLDCNRLAAVHDDCLLEIHRLDGGAVMRFEGEGYGAAILRASPPIVQVASHPMRHWSDPWSRLMAIGDDDLVDIGTFEGRYSFTASSRGRLLGRLDRYRPGAGTGDLLVDLAAGEARLDELGHYDCQNNYVGIDGAPHLYLLQGNPETGVEKRLCRLLDDDEVEPLWPLLPAEGSGAREVRWLLGCYLEDEEGPGVAIAGRHYDPATLQYRAGFIYRKPVDRDREMWRHVTRDAASAIVHVPAAGVIVAAILDGTLLMLDAVSGEVRVKGRAMIEGVPTVVYAMDVAGTALALGTFDGRIAVVDVAEYLTEQPAVGQVELAW